VCLRPNARQLLWLIPGVLLCVSMLATGKGVPLQDIETSDRT
jgi:hypothetical protein